MIETRTTATPVYPGSFVSETGLEKLVTSWPREHALAVFDADPHAFAVAFETKDYERWRNDDGDIKWLPAPRTNVRRWMIYIGKHYTLDELKAAQAADSGARLENVIWNVEVNGYAGAVQTRRGNWQLVSKDDVVIDTSVAAR